MQGNISILAGPRALERVRDEGLNLSRVKVICGASGSAKFLVLTHIDRMLMQMFKGRKKPLYLVGTSIGAFRMAAFCQEDPLAAMDILESAYIRQQYGPGTTKKDVSRQTRKIINAFVDDRDIPGMLDHPFMRISILADKCRGLLKKESLWLQSMGIGLAAGVNLISRRGLKLFFERALFHVPDRKPPFSSMNEFPLNVYGLTPANFKDALLSSGSIPFAMEGVSDIDGAPGVFRDGGILDYHPDLPFLPEDDGLVLYPHFFETITPGWFDKKLNRKPIPDHMANVILVAPSPSFVRTLPFSKIPDRKDFTLFRGKDRERMAYWKIVVEKSRILGDELAEVIESGKIRSAIKAI